jgi:hypothetical protein
MKKLILAAACCIMGSVAVKAQVFANTTPCDVKIQQICVDVNPCAKNAGPSILLTSGTIIPIPFVPCTTTQETMYLVCWANCPNTCTVVSATPPPLICLAGVPYSAPMPPCAVCGPATVTVDPFSGTLKVY